MTPVCFSLSSLNLACVRLITHLLNKFLQLTDKETKIQRRKVYEVKCRRLFFGRTVWTMKHLDLSLWPPSSVADTIMGSREVYILMPRNMAKGLCRCDEVKHLEVGVILLTTGLTSGIFFSLSLFNSRFFESLIYYFIQPAFTICIDLCVLAKKKEGYERGAFMCLYNSFLKHWN